MTNLDIYRFYLGKFSLSEKILSPLRQEKTPSFGLFQARDGKYLWKDFGTGKCGNSVSLVMELFGLSYKGAKQKISNDLSGLTSFVGIPNKPLSHTKQYKDLKIKIKKFSYNDLNYWRLFGINESILKKFEVFSISHYWINDVVYYVNSNKLAFAYHFNGKFKIYFPYSDFKWLNNCQSTTIQGLDQLGKSDLLIITKSLKDIMTLYSLGFTSIAPQSENVILEKEVLDSLYQTYPNIITLLDNDESGFRASKKYNDLGIPSIFIPNESLCKDISDYFKQYGKEQTEELLKKLI